MKTIVFQGDSITDALRSRSEDTYRGSGYATMIAGQLGMDRPGEFQFLNRGVSGNRLINLLDRLDTDILHLKPDYLSILIGINDVWRKYDSSCSLDANWFETYYDQLIRQVKQALPQTKIMILEPFALLGDATKAHWNSFRADTEALAAVSRRIAQQHGLIFVPLMEKFDQAAKQPCAEYWIYDGVHPTAMGHELIKRAWLEAFPG